MPERIETRRGAPDTRKIAESAGYSGYYAHFRHLSGGATHASLKSVFGYLGRDEGGGYTGHEIGPDEEGIPEALHFAMLGIAVSVDALAKISDYNDSAKLGEIQNLFNRYFNELDPYLSSIDPIAANVAG